VNSSAFSGLIANNFISIYNGWPLKSYFGLYIEDVYNLDVCYNSVNILEGGLGSSCIVLYNCSGLLNKNNIYSHGGDGQVYYLYNSSLGSDYNCLNYYGNAVMTDTYTTLSAFQNALSLDLNSINVAPDFVSDSNLHINTFALNGAGTPLTNVTKDIDGDIRDINFPDIGADEFNYINNYDAAITEIIEPYDTSFTGVNYLVKAKIKNVGFHNLTSIPVSYDIGGTQVINETWTGNISTGNEIVYSFNQTFTSPANPGAFNICVYSGLTNDEDNSNDTTCKSISNIIDRIATYKDEDLWLGQNIPNPFNQNTLIRFSIPQNDFALFEIRDVFGKLIINREINAKQGINQIDLDLNTVPSGIYFYSIVFKGRRLTRKMVLNR
jgi:hypothetical protein